ncbi:MAG: replicative DNA helicase [Candidatus Marinimicrobia bacterium]|nr:replicative DNA helicase [Candidatus Neomarinimicrobiota bacterium]
MGGLGKSTLALNIARNAAGKGGRIGIFSMEMSNYQIAMRMLTAEAKVNSHDVRRGRLQPRQWSKLSTAVGRLSQLPVFVDDTAGMNILELRSRVRRFKAEHNVDMVIIDYMQLIAGHGRSDNRQQEMSEISRSLKALARELDIAVLALSQLSRAPEQRPGKDKRPIMSDLRESGAIEQDADMILFLFRPFVYTREESDDGFAELIIGKQRNGPTGMIKLAFNNSYARFDPYAPEDILSQLPTEETPF